LFKLNPPSEPITRFSFYKNIEFAGKSLLVSKMGNSQN